MLAQIKGDNHDLTIQRQCQHWAHKA